MGWLACLAAFAAVGIWLASTGCKPKPQPVEEAPPAPTPVIPAGRVFFIQKGHLVRMDLETNQITPLTGGKSSEWFPAASPTGTEVVYWSNCPPQGMDSANWYKNGGTYNLWKRNFDGSNPVQLTFDESNTLRSSDQNLLVNAAPSWSSDGKRILYSMGGDLWIMDRDGYNPETLLLGRSALCPILSPDSKTVFFVSNFEDAVFNLCSLTLSDKMVKKITNYTDWNMGSPSFSRDGSKILYNLYRADMSQVYLINLDGSNPVNLTNNNHSYSPRFAQLDWKIIFCTYDTGANEDLNLYIVDATGANPKALTTAGGVSPSWCTAPIGGVPAVAVPTPVGKKASTEISIQ
jgi:Tol biopolymer transport system component